MSTPAPAAHGPTSPASELALPLYGANVGQAIGRFFRKYATYSGRASRSEYWWVTLALLLVGAALRATLGEPLTMTPDEPFALTTYDVVSGLFNLAVLVPSLAVFWRRMHDTGRPGLWFLLAFVPIVGAIVLIVFAALPSTPSNEYGPGPEAVGRA